MHTTQLTCPFCGSVLTFGQQVPAGTLVSCLICNRTFPAPQAVAAATPPPPTIMPKPAVPVPKPPVYATVPKDEPAVAPPVPVASNGAGPKRAAADAKLPVAIPTAKLTRPRRDDAPSSGSGWLGTLALGAVVLAMLGGLVFFFWQAVQSRLNNPPTDEPGPVAAGKNPDAASGQNKNDAGKGAAVASGQQPPHRAANGTDDDPDDEPDARPAHKTKGPLLPRRVTTNDKKIEPDTLPVVSVTTPAAAPPDGPEAKRVNDAIDRGVQYLKARQGPDGRWLGNSLQHPAGVTCLTGLTLLECKVPPNDPGLQRAARYVRANIPSSGFSYEICLAVLFLDRLGDPADRPIIQGLALRLLGSQTDFGGWHYMIRPLAPADMQQLYLFLQSHRPNSPTLPRTVKQSGTPEKTNPGTPGDPFQELNKLLNEREQPEAEDPPQKNEAPAAKDAPKRKRPPIAPNTLSPNLQNLPIVLNQVRGKTRPPQPQESILMSAGDNSNTQFALLALWAARRHDVPSEFAILMAQQRFQATQNADGGWGYQVHNPSTPSMTGVGLLAYAMGHGVQPSAEKGKTFEDPAIQRGLRALGQSIGMPQPGENAKPGMQNLYFLWTVERVAMLYDLKTIGGKDWYGWGSQVLTANQQPAGSWDCGGIYPGSCTEIDTCFALLFLRRSNLVQDLTENLRLYMTIRDPDAGR